MPPPTILTDYRRDIVSYPLPPGRSGENTNRQEGKCNNFNYRKDADGQPRFIVQHHTVADFERTVKIFTTGKTSSHYVIEKDGTIQEFVSPKYRAYHAGKGNLAKSSKLAKPVGQAAFEDDMNSWSIGIENVNNGAEEFTNEQMKANVLLCEYICDEHPTIDPKYMLGHSDWAIGRKVDPSPFFDWEKLANASQLFPDEVSRSFGVYPRKTELHLKPDPEVVLSYDKYNKGEIPREEVCHYQQLLREYGYAIVDDEIGEVGPGTQQAILAYRIHFSGREILNDDRTRRAWLDICKEKDGQPNYGARNMLSQFDENDVLCLENTIVQFANR